MKFIHTADLHIGKIINGFCLLEDQKLILNQIIEIACLNKVDAVILSGDIYDRSVPSSDAVIVLDYFISELIHNNIKVLAINGNHDSPERLGFANTILAKQGFYMESSFHCEMKSITLEDEYGTVDFYFMPFIRTAFINDCYEEEIKTIQDSVKAIIEHSKINTENRNVLIAHHFVTNSGSLPGEEINSDTIFVGDIDNVDVSCFHMFDYTALGHIHRAMKIGDRNTYYAGSPLKYSVKEVTHEKGVFLVELNEKGIIHIEKKILNPLRDLRVIKGNLNQLLNEEVVNLENPNDYICAILTNQEEIIDPIGKLRNVYPNIMQVLFEKREKHLLVENESMHNIKEMTVEEMFDSFYQYVTNTSMDDERKDIMKEIIQEAKRGEYC